MLVLELGCKTFVCIVEERIRRLVLASGLEYLGPREAPGLLCIEVCCVFVRAEVHAEGQFILRQFPTFDQVVVIVRIANEVDIKVGRRSH